MRKANKDWLAEHADYTGEGDIGWRCKKTGTLLEAEQTSRTIWNESGPGPCASSEGVQTVVEVYCPECTNKTKVAHGTPIQEGELISI